MRKLVALCSLVSLVSCAKPAHGEEMPPEPYQEIRLCFPAGTHAILFGKPAHSFMVGQSLVYWLYLTKEGLLLVEVENGRECPVYARDLPRNLRDAL